MWLTKVLYKTTLSQLPNREAAGLHLPPAVAARLHYEPIQILERVDSAKRYNLILDPSFPLALRLYGLNSGQR